jgi:transglutaminase-like putative cysteine protease
MLYQKFIISFLILTTLSSCGKKQDFIPESSQKKEVKHQFEQRKSMFEQKTLFRIFEEDGMSREEQDAMEFLYAYMPLVDIADYDGEYFLSMTRAAFEARNTFHWGKEVPADLFRHFVLPPRVNNENLDTARIVFFNQLKERIKDLSMYDAALEVNHWCHEKITYRPSDSRTSAPLASMKTGFGRCGEESTFTVTALRAVGIPARQCYTPRWAHTDDNHAWVEVWCSGSWYFMGACEPEPELNIAWFTYPAKRAMMVHTNVFGKYYGPESKTGYPLFTRINVLENYTDTKKLEVTVYDLEGRTVEGADVKYLIYNYAEYYPVYEKTTDKNGRSDVVSGLGDMVVWACKDGFYGYGKVSLATTDKFSVILDKEPGEEYSEEVDITPPPEQAHFSATVKNPDYQKNNLRLKYEDSLRAAYLSSFMTREKAIMFAKENGLDTASVAGFIAKSEGNWDEISRFISANAKNENSLRMLSSLSDKDLRDTPAEVLQSHLDNTLPYDKSAGYNLDVYIKGILSPVISLELIRKWRPYLQEKFRDMFSEKAGFQEIKNWIENNIKIDNGQNYPKCPISPVGVLNTGMADKSSRDIFFVAVCRSFDIPSYIDMATSSILVWKDGVWNPVSFDPAAPVKDYGELVLNYTEASAPGRKTGKADNQSSANIPKYWIHYTVSIFRNGIFEPLDFENDSRVAHFPAKLSLEEGYYRLTTGNRYTDGRVLARNEYFNIKHNQVVIKDLTIRKLEAENRVYGKIDTVISRSVYDKGLVVCFIEPDREPTKHLMNELPGLKIDLDKWEGSFIFAVPSEKLTKGFTAELYKGLPARSVFMSGGSGAEEKETVQNDKVVAPDISTEELLTLFLKSADHSFRDNYPLIYIVNSSGEIIFQSEGYKIGLPDLIKRSLP